MRLGGKSAETPKQTPPAKTPHLPAWENTSGHKSGMITAGTVALFCSRELHSESDENILTADGSRIAVEAAIERHSGRYRYGGGFRWKRQSEVIRLQMYWLTAAVPKDLRLHLFGTTPHRTIGCLVVECEAPDLIVNSIAYRRLHRNAIDFSVVRVIEYDVDIEAFEEKDTLTIGVDIDA